MRSTSQRVNADTHNFATTSALRSSPVYSSTDETAAQETSKPEVTASTWRTLLSQARTPGTRLHTFVACMFLAVLVTLVVVIVVTIQQLTSQPIRRQLLAAHIAHVTIVHARADYATTGITRVVNVLASLWVSTPAILNPATLPESQLCNLVANGFGVSAYTTALGFLSESLNEGQRCYQTRDYRNGATMLTDLKSKNGGYVGGAYLVDSDTYRYHEPRVEMFPVPEGALSVADFFAANPAIDELITAMADYRNGTGDIPAPFLMWESQASKPTSMLYTFPVAAYDTPHAVATGKPDGRDILQGRMDFQSFFLQMEYTDATRAILLDARGLRAGETNPYVIAASWTPNVTDDMDVWLHHNTSAFHYTHADDITDNIMRAGLKHVVMSDFRRDAFDKRKEFWYCGVQSVVTWGNYTTTEGLSIAYVIVDTAGPVRGLLEPKCAGIICCAVFLVLLLPLIFTRVINELFGRPMRLVARSLTRAGRLGNKRARRHIRDDRRLVIVEVDELIDAHNDAMDTLNAVEAYLPAALFGDSESLDSCSSSLTSGSDTLTPSERTDAYTTNRGPRTFNSSASFFESVASAAWQRSGTGEASTISQMRMTFVTLRPVKRAEDGAAPVDDVPSELFTDQPMPCGLEPLQVLNRDTYNAPTPAFTNRWALQDYAAVVMQAADQRNGTVMHLGPDFAVVAFGGMMEALTRGNSAAALAPAIEARACATDAMSAVLFAQDVRSRLRQFAEHSNTAVPDVKALVETNTYGVGIYRAAKLQQNLSVAVGPAFGLALCEEQMRKDAGGLYACNVTSQVLSDRLRFVPCSVLHTCARKGGRGTYMTQIIHQLVDGSANAPSWHAQHDLLVQGLESVYCGNYRTALALFQKIPEAARGDMTLMSGNLLAEAMRTGNATGVASKKRYGSAQTRILEELMHLCRRLVGRERAANALVPPESYMDLLARQLPALPAAGTGCEDAYAGSTTSDVMSSCPFVPMTRHNSSTLAAHLCGHTRTVRVEGLRGNDWYLPLCVGVEGGARPLQMNGLALGATGCVCQMDERRLFPEALETFCSERLLNFIEAYESPYLIRPEDIVIDPEVPSAAVIYELMAYPTGRSFRDIFPHTLPRATTYQQLFTAMSALAALDLQGDVHASFSLADIVLLPEGAVKVKALRGKPEDILRCFQFSPTRYISPEEAAGEYPTIFSNVYSLCVMAIEFMTRALPYRWTDVAAADRARSEAVALQEQCGPEFAAALAGGLIEVVPIPDDLDIHPTIKRIFELCLQRDASLRPRPRDVLRMFRSDPHLSDIVSLFPRGPWEN